MITVRRAVAADVPWLLDQLRDFDAFYGSSRSLYPDLDVAEQIVAGLVDTQPFFIAENADGPIGFVAGFLAPHNLNPEIRVLCEQFWWVDPAYRGSRAGLALLNELIAFGRVHADWIIMTLEHESPVNPQTLTRRGFRPKETSYLLEIGS